MFYRWFLLCVVVSAQGQHTLGKIINFELKIKFLGFGESCTHLSLSLFYERELQVFISDLCVRILLHKTSRDSINFWPSKTKRL